MHYKPLTAAVFAAAALLTVAGCSSNQSLKTTDGRFGNGLFCFKNAD